MADKAACDALTTASRIPAGDCELVTEYRNADAQAGTCGAPGADTVDPKGPGEPCSAHSECKAGLCGPRGVCTLPCATDEACADAFPAGHCVGEGSLGYCISSTQFTSLCPEGSVPAGVPTRCRCTPGFHWAEDMSRCVGPAADGEWCYENGDCSSGYCLSGEADEGGRRSWCSELCSKDSDCTSLRAAAQVSRACCGPTTDGPLECVIDYWCNVGLDL